MDDEIKDDVKKDGKYWNPLLISFPDSDKVNHLSFKAETLYVRLLAVCDDNANYFANPKILMCKVFAKRFAFGQVDDAMVAGMLQELLDAGLIILYKVDNEEFLHVVNCYKCIRKDRKPYVVGRSMEDVKVDVNLIAVASSPKTATKTTKPAKEQEAYSEDFELFWQAYPRKEGKGKAFESWQRIKPDDELVKEILRAIAIQTKSVQWNKDNGQFIPHPTTWLNQKRWTDQLRMPTNGYTGGVQKPHIR